MDENRVEGTVRKATGKVQEGVGRAMGDAKMQTEGMANEIRGSAQDPDECGTSAIVPAVSNAIFAATATCARRRSIHLSACEATNRSDAS
jgi:uncharacterized protein YjbJ (UPF0337 family)